MALIANSRSLDRDCSCHSVSEGVQFSGIELDPNLEVEGQELFHFHQHFGWANVNVADSTTPTRLRRICEGDQAAGTCTRYV